MVPIAPAKSYSLQRPQCFGYNLSARYGYLQANRDSILGRVHGRRFRDE